MTPQRGHGQNGTKNAPNEGQDQNDHEHAMEQGKDVPPDHQPQPTLKYRPQNPMAKEGDILPLTGDMETAPGPHPLTTGNHTTETTAAKGLEAAMIEVVITVTTTAELTALQQKEAAMIIMSMRNESKHAMGLIFPAQGGADPRDGLEEVVARVLAAFERQRYTVKLTSEYDHFS